MWKRSVLAAGAAVCLSVGAAQAAEVPRRAPEFAINLVGGKQALLSQYRGKVVALVFILTYCPHCQITVKHLSEFQNEYGPRGFQVLGTAIEDMAAMMLPDFLKRFNPPFPVGYNQRPQVLEFLEHPEKLQMFMPQLVFIDRQGNIRAQYAGENSEFFGANQRQNIEAKIQELLKNGSGAGKKK